MQPPILALILTLILACSGSIGVVRSTDLITSSKLALMLIFPLFFNSNVLRSWVEWLWCAGVPVMMDVGGDPSPLPAELAETLTLVIPNSQQ